MRGAFAGSQLNAATANAEPLRARALSLLHGQSLHIQQNTAPAEGDGNTLPEFSDLARELGVPLTRSHAPSPKSRLPLRILSGACTATPLEKSLWRTHSDGGLHELLSAELISAIASRIRRVVSRVVLHGLASRQDLNGLDAVVLGARDERTGRVPVRVTTSGECVRCKPGNCFHADDGGGGELPLVLECGAGSGALSHFLSAALAGYARVLATDSHRDKLGKQGTLCEVVHMDSEAAIERHQPSYVLISWMPSTIDWTLRARACERVREYMLLGETDGSTCGDGWATWGVVPENGYEYGLDEDSVPPYTAEGFVRAELPEVAQWQICRFDSHEARGFSSAIAFTRQGSEPPEPQPTKAGQVTAQAGAQACAAGGEEESLEASWERMQRSLKAGTAQKLDVQMQIDVTK